MESVVVSLVQMVIAIGVVLVVQVVGQIVQSRAGGADILCVLVPALPPVALI